MIQVSENPIGPLIYGNSHTLSRGSNIRRRHREKVVFCLPALKPEAEMVSEASKGHYDLDNTENIKDFYR